MNHTHKVVWSHAAGAMVVVSELATSRGKANKKSSVVAAVAARGAAAVAALAIGGVLMPEGVAQAAAGCDATGCSGVIYNTAVEGAIPEGPPFTFTDNALFNANSANALTGFQIVQIKDTSAATISAANALNTGLLTAQDFAIVSINVANGVTGGTIRMEGNSALNLNATDAITGGLQEIGTNATLSLNAVGAISGGSQFIQGTVLARAEGAISGASQEVSGGRLVADAEGAITESTVTVANGGKLVLGKNDGLTNSVLVNLAKADGGMPAGSFDLNGFSTSIGGLNSAGGAGGTQGIVSNTGVAAATLTVDTAVDQHSNYDGAIMEGMGGGGAIALVKRGAGSLTLTGYSNYTGGTQVLGGTLLGSTDTLVGDISNMSELVFNQDFDGTYSGNISGSGITRISGNGTVALRGVNSHAGTVIKNGRALVASDAALGAAGGELTLDNGVLAVDGALHSTRKINIIGSGTIDTAAAVDLQGDITGAGDLTIRASGTTVTLGGVNTYSNTYVQSGTLIGTSNSIKGNINNLGAVVFDQGFDGQHVGNITGAGQLIKDGLGNLTLKGSSASDWTVKGGRLTTSAQWFSGSVMIDPLGTFALDETADVSFAGKINGTGNFLKAGAGSLTLLADSSAFAGTTTVQDGKLIVNTVGAGQLGGTLNVLNGGLLKGSGTVGTTNLFGGAVIAPGNSIGTLTVNGDLNFDANSTYEVETNPTGTQSDLIRVTGTAHLAGKVAHVGFSGTYAPNSVYTILEAGAVNGTFGSVQSTYAFLDPALKYDATTVKMELKRNDTPISGGGTSGNGGSAGGGVGSVGGEDPSGGAVVPGTGVGNSGGTNAGGAAGGLTKNIYDAVVVLSKDEVGNALELLSGEIHASTTSALLNNSRMLREVSLAQLRNHFSAAPVAMPRSDVATWVEVVGQSSKLDGDSNASSVDYTMGGVFLGAHADVGRGWRLGGSFGYTDGKVKVDDKASSADVGTYSAAIFAGNSFAMGEKGSLNLLLGSAYSWHNIDTKRRVQFTGVNESLKADYDASTAQLFGEVGYAMPLTGSVIVEPFAGVAVIRQKTDSFTESGGIAALNGERVTNTITSTTLGLRSKAAFDVGKTEGIVTGALGWRHASGDVLPGSKLSFAGGSQFVVTGAPIAKNAAVVELGVNVAVAKNASLGLSYSGQYGSGNQDTAGSVNLRVRF